ncbi:MAG: pyruvate dehydrogenase (acetyl-transferring), homodimeric type [Chrysiogenetes bacterium]|nr:pyruvate dehydrogenase (acetyl-transferring), homodimeric type [Chrysiogenetes bacterium]
MSDRGDIDPKETEEWIDALDSVLEAEGVERAHYLIEALIDKARRSGAQLPYKATTAYLNTIHVNEEKRNPGDPEMEYRIRSYMRWNAMAMVVQANRHHAGIGGHIATFASSATLYDVGYNHFFKGADHPDGEDFIFFQGHGSPGMYARAYLEGRLTKDDLHRFRREASGKGLSSYPHPWLMPNFWQFPTVSMGLGPLQAIYQARFMKYLQHRGIIPASKAKVWAFLGDGETDEPEALGAISLAAREKLDNLIFVINCNLQRLDGPVRGNGKIIQELEGVFRGAGWNVLKVIWGDQWDKLLAKDKDGLLVQRMEEAVDGDYQNYAVRDGAWSREHFFGKHPKLREMVANLTDQDIKKLNRGGHDPQKVYAAYAEATSHEGQPTCILAKTVKGYGMGEAGEGQNPTHQIKKLGEEALKAFRDRYRLPISDDEILEAPFYKPADDSQEMQYLHERRKEMGGFVPQRRNRTEPLEVPGLEIFDIQLKDSGDREFSTTMAFVRMLSQMTRDKVLAKHLVPIVPDEARTFGMEGLFRQLGIYASEGQLYEPVDHDQIMYYREDRAGQILQEGINEAGATCSWIAAGTAYANYGVNMIPFFIYYSMFGFQRVGDLLWAAGDIQARGFLLGGTSGRTTLNGEGLQHQDGHSHLLAAAIPNCIAYDPTYAYELAVIMHDGLRRMYKEQENVFYYITLLNENYHHPEMPRGAEEGIVKGMYLLREGKGAADAPRVQLFGGGAILREVLKSAETLEKDFGVAADVWSVTSFPELRRDGLDCEHWNLLHPAETPRVPFITKCLEGRKGPVVAATDYVRLHADRVRAFVPGNYRVLGTDGFGRSDTREALRDFFEVDHRWVTLAALKSLADEEAIPPSKVIQALEKFGIDADKPLPWTV